MCFVVAQYDGWLSTLYLFGPRVSLQWILTILFDCLPNAINWKLWELTSMKQLSTTSKLESFFKVSCDFHEATFHYLKTWKLFLRCLVILMKQLFCCLKILKLECMLQDIEWEPLSRNVIIQTRQETRVKEYFTLEWLLQFQHHNIPSGKI
jgi:hypothetical protein